MKRLFYIFIRSFIGLSYKFYFNRIEYIGEELIPRGKPFIFASNHQNAFMDAFVIGCLGPVTSHYLTRSDVFKGPFVWFLHALNMIPIYRIRDGRDQMAMNDQVFEIVKGLLLKRKSVTIFPEGNHGEFHYLRPLSKGTARIALDSQDSIDEPVYIVPVGLNYFHHRRPRRKLIIHYGEKIDVSSYKELYLENKQKAYRKLKEDLTERMRSCLVIPDPEQYEERRKVFTRKNEELNFKQIREKASRIEVEDERSYSWPKFLTEFLIIFNFGPLLLIRWVLTNKVKDVVFFASLKHFLGAFTFPIWWLILFLGFGLPFGWLWGGVAIGVSIVMLYLRQGLVRLLPG